MLVVQYGIWYINKAKVSEYDVWHIVWKVGIELVIIAITSTDNHILFEIVQITGLMQRISL
jgi:hypothetical protein